MVNEAVPTDHYLLRKQERGNILKIFTSREVYEEYPKEKVFSALKQTIEDRLMRILSGLESPGKALPSNNYTAFKVLEPVLVYKGQEYPVTMEVEYTKFLKDGTKEKHKNLGNTYVVVKAGDAIVTLMLIPNKADLYQQVRNHIKNSKDEYIDLDKVKIREIPSKNYIFNIDIEELFKGKNIERRAAEVTKEELPYKVRTDYRKGGNFTHDQYGTGKIVTTSAGVSGDPGSTGILDWVDVDFGKEFVKGGKLTTVRRIPRVYATAYWLDKK